MQRVKSLKHAKNEVRFERVFISITKIFATITQEAPGFFGGPSSLDHEGLILMKIFCKSGSGSQPDGKVPGRKKPERGECLIQPFGYRDDWHVRTTDFLSEQ